VKAVRAIAIGGLIVGTLDLLDAFIFFGIRNGVTPIRILQSIAAGVFGRTSFQMGNTSAGLGLLLHYTIAWWIVTTCYLLTWPIKFIVRRPIVAGMIFGIGAYCVMNYVVIPLSATSRGAFAWPVFANGILIHMFGVGIPSALAARAARGRTS
jgi:hypothetical protein